MSFYRKLLLSTAFLCIEAHGMINLEEGIRQTVPSLIRKTGVFANTFNKYQYHLYSGKKSLTRFSTYTKPEQLGLNMDQDKFDSIVQFRKDLAEKVPIYEKEAKIYEAEKDQSIVLTIGTTGCGKSTLLNLLLGNKLKATRKGYDIEDPSKPHYPIGHTNKSETIFPKFLKNGDSKLILVDLPGLADTRGHAISFMNAVIANRL